MPSSRSTPDAPAQRAAPRTGGSYDQSAQRRKRSHGLFEAREIDVALQVKVGGRTTRRDLPCKRGLSALPGAQQGDNRAAAHCRRHLRHPAWAFDQGRHDLCISIIA
jgi:hypothetical protein